MREARLGKQAGQYEIAYRDDDDVELVAFGPFHDLNNETFAALVGRMPWRHNMSFSLKLESFENECAEEREGIRRKDIRRIAEDLAHDTDFMAKRGGIDMVNAYVKDARNERT